MKKKDFLLSAVLSTLLLTSNLSAQSIKCKNGKCFINLSRLTPTTNLPTIHNFKIKKIASFKMAPTATMQKQISKDIIAFDHSAYVMQKNEQVEIIAKDGRKTLVFSPSKYIMSKAEIKQYYKKNHTNEEALMVHTPIVANRNEKIEDKIIKKATLPTSEYYCRDQKKAVYSQELKAYQCTI